MKIVVFRKLLNRFSDPPEWFAKRLQIEFRQVEVTEFAGTGEIALAGAEIFFTWWLAPEHLQSAPKLRWIQSPSAAVHQLLFPKLVQSDILLTNGRAVHGPVVAEHAIALVMALAKRLPQSMRFQHKREWGQRLIWEGKPAPRELAGSMLGLIGLGSIGRNIAKRAQAIGMKVMATREHADQSKVEDVDEILPGSQIDQLLEQSDFVILAAPLTPATRHLLNADRMEKMKPFAYLVNVGRGPLIDQAALISALKKNRIAGAALDVFDEEPLPADSELWDLDNVLITPHTAGFSQHMWDRQYRLFSENLQRFLAHAPLQDLVDKQAGY